MVIFHVYLKIGSAVVAYGQMPFQKLSLFSADVGKLISTC